MTPLAYQNKRFRPKAVNSPWCRIVQLSRNDEDPDHHDYYVRTLCGKQGWLNEREYCGQVAHNRETTCLECLAR